MDFGYSVCGQNLTNYAYFTPIFCFNILQIRRICRNLVNKNGRHSGPALSLSREEANCATLDTLARALGIPVYEPGLSCLLIENGPGLFSA